MRILIATGCVPKDFEVFCAKLRTSAKTRSLQIPEGIIWTDGAGCSNLALDIVGDDEVCEKFADHLTMTLMPSKWCTTADALPKADTCTLN
jgi:hypothetical protein